MAHHYASAYSFVLFLCALPMTAQVPDLSGSWQLNAAKSKVGDEKTLHLDIQQQGKDIQFSRTYQDEDGKQATAKFTCTVGGSECAFNDNGHSAKASLWYDGPTLVFLKTNGDKHDSTVEWHLSVSGDGNTMTVTRETMEPRDVSEKLVFTKEKSIASR